MRRYALVLAGIALAGLLGCAGAADLQDQFQVSEYRMPYDKRLQIEVAAPIIVVGLVLEANDVGQPRRSPGDPRIKTQLTRIKIWVEQVIKGSISPNPVEFYYFRFPPEANDRDLRRRRYSPEYLDRRIYFLKPWNGGYRSVGDVTDYTLQVRSGVHDKGFCQGKSPGCCIAEMLLVLGLRGGTDSFVADLYNSAYIAEVLCSRELALRLLADLAKHPNQRIADEARDVIRVMTSK